MGMKAVHGSRSLFLLLLLALVLVLSACSAKSKADILHYAGVLPEEDYKSYLTLADSGQLDQDGGYAAEEIAEPEEVVPPEGSVHVTFAQNAYINVKYYLDAGLTKPVALDACYLMPGECIYATDPVCEHPGSKYYQFDRFCVYACSKTGDREEELLWNSGEDPALVLRVPEGVAGTEISVMPLGRYEKRSLELYDYYEDNAGNPQDAGGTWTVNEEEKPVSAAWVEVSPVEQLRVDFKYDAEKYEYVSSTPSSFYHKNGMVRFESTSAYDEVERYSVKLRSLEGGWEFDPTLRQYQPKNGTIKFYYGGKEITEPTNIPDGGIIEYEGEPASGFLPKSGEIKVNASDPDANQKAIVNAVVFYRDEEVTVILPRPTTGGALEYTNEATGKVITGETCKLRAESQISVKFNPWRGWSPISDRVYLVTDTDNQTVCFDGIDLMRPFEEGPGHKPDLQVILTDSLKDTAFQFNISASGIDNESSTGLSYSSGKKPSGVENLLNRSDRIIFNQDGIGTDNGVTITAEGDVVLPGYALKIETVTTRKGVKGSQTSIQYISETDKRERTVELYKKEELPTSSVIYENVTIKVSYVQIATYTPRTTNHATISIKLGDENNFHTLKDGEVLETSREVEVIITPSTGYYITGSKLSSGVYRETMKYSKWEKDCQKILDKHPAEKLWYVTLDTSDSYGTCVYKLDKRTVSGRIGIHKGQKLTMEYTVTDDDYRIVHGGLSGWFENATNSDKESIDIPVDESLHDRTIYRSDYITVEKKEG